MQIEGHVDKGIYEWPKDLSSLPPAQLNEFILQTWKTRDTRKIKPVLGLSRVSKATAPTLMHVSTAIRKSVTIPFLILACGIVSNYGWGESFLMLAGISFTAFLVWILVTNFGGGWKIGGRYSGNIHPVLLVAQEYGVARFFDGHLYEGEWNNNMPWGFGVFERPDGTTFFGAVVSGEPICGVEKTKNAIGHVIAEKQGRFRDGKLWTGQVLRGTVLESVRMNGKVIHAPVRNGKPAKPPRVVTSAIEAALQAQKHSHVACQHADTQSKRATKFCRTCSQCQGHFDHDLKVCSACKLMPYCSETCMYTHWQTHKPLCLVGRQLQGRPREVIDDKSRFLFDKDTEPTDS